MNHRTQSDLFGSVLKVASGIFLGMMLVWMVRNWMLGYQLSRAAVAIEQSFAEATAKTQAERRQRDKRALDKRIADQRREEVKAVAEARLLAEARRKDQAWVRFFQRSDECLRTSSVECGNQYIRARREFERRYSAGEFR
jgi:hypothetical protein